MSAGRDRENAAGLLKLLGLVPPAPEIEQPLDVAAAGAGGGSAGGLSAWSRSITIEAALTPGLVYYYAAGWSALSPSVGTRAVIGVCTAYVDGDPDTSTLLLAGEYARSGTAGALLYAGAAGAITETFPGNEDDETTGAPWVWPIGWQYDATLAIILPPTEPYRPRIIRYCLADGTTQLDLTMREIPPDPV